MLERNHELATWTEKGAQSGAGHDLSLLQLSIPEDKSAGKADAGNAAAWTRENIVNPALNTAVITPYNAVAHTVNAVGNREMLKEKDRLFVPEAEMFSSKWFAQGISAGLAMVVPYGLAGKATGKLLAGGSKMLALEGGAAAALSSQKTAMILGAALYDGFRVPEAGQSRLGNALGGAAAFTVFEFGNPALAAGSLPVASRLAGRMAIGAGAATTQHTVSEVVSKGRLPDAHELFTAGLGGAAMNLALPAAGRFLSGSRETAGQSDLQRASIKQALATLPEAERTPLTPRDVLTEKTPEQSAFQGRHLTIREKLKDTIEQTLTQSVNDRQLGALTETRGFPVVIERPRQAEHGDYACGIAMKLKGKSGMQPLEIAEQLAHRLSENLKGVATVEVAHPGYLNFRLEPGLLKDVLQEVHRDGADFGRSDIGGGKKILLEYVSANPTGDLHIGHGRGGVYGSSLANVMKFAGFKVDQEFYINDAGAQITQLGRSSWAGYQRALGRQIEYPADGYPEDSLAPYIDRIVQQHKSGFLSLTDAEGEQKLASLTKDMIIDSQRQVLERLGIKFDRWTSEKPLHDEGKVDAALARLSEQGKVYESEGALWLKAKELGDERDRVLVKGGGNKTYLAADAAYHLEKFDRGYDTLINIWGADHHGQVPGLKASVEALGKNPDQLEVILTQIVNLSRDGQMVRMSKRAGTVVLLSDLMDEVGRDAVRYYLSETSPQTPINFDLELAKKTSSENPAYYIQYAHARCASILKKALEPSVNRDTQQMEQPPVAPDQWQEFQKAYRTSPEVFDQVFDKNPEVFVHQKALITRLDMFPKEVEEAASTRNPGRIARYAFDLAGDLQKFYETSRVVSDDPAVTRARLGVVVATKQVLSNALALIGVSAPDRL